jgi:hypothetical protein
MSKINMTQTINIVYVAYIRPSLTACYISSHSSSNMRGKTFFLVVIMAAILLLMGEQKQVSHSSIYVDNFTTEK